MDKAGILDPVDHFIYKNIEDPLLTFWFRNSYQFKIINDDVIPTEEEGCCLFASNHQSIMDPLTSGLAIVHTSRRMAFQLTKAEMGDDPLMGNYVSMNQVIYIRRGENDQEAMQQCVDAMVEQNRPVLVYPEGTYGPGDGVLLKFKTGATRLAWDAQVPIIPMATYGLDKVCPGKHVKQLKTKGLIRVTFGDRLELKDLFPGKKPGDKIEQPDFVAATEKVQAAVQALWDGMDKDIREEEDEF